MRDLDRLLQEQRVLICCGSGGVGKTTASAALAMTFEIPSGVFFIARARSLTRSPYRSTPSRASFSLARCILARIVWPSAFHT